MSRASFSSAAAVLLVLALSGQAIANPPPKGSIYASDALGGSIERYIQKFNEEQGKKSSDPSDGAPPDLDQLVRDQAQAGSVADTGEVVATRISNLSNGKRYSERLWDNIRSLVTDVQASDRELYDSALETLLSDYYEHPENRDAIAALFAQINIDAGAGLQKADENPYPRYIARGTIIAWSVITIWHMRGNIASGARGAYSGLRRGTQWIASLFREAPKASSEAIVLAEEAQAQARKIIPTFEQAREAVKAEGKTVEAVSASASEEGPKLLKAAFPESGGAAKEGAKVGKKALNRLAKFAGEMGLSLATGGLAGGVYAADLESLPPKVEPLVALDMIQAFAIADLEVKVADLETRVNNLYDDKHLDTTMAAMYEGKKSEVMAQLAALEAEATQDRIEYNHFDEHAKRYKGNISLPQVLADLNKSSEPSEEELRTRSRLQRFVKHSKRVNGLVNKSTAELRHADEVRNGSAAEEAYVSLAPIFKHLTQVQVLLKVTREGLSAFTALDHADQGKAVQQLK